MKAGMIVLEPMQLLLVEGRIAPAIKHCVDDWLVCLHPIENKVVEAASYKSVEALARSMRASGTCENEKSLFHAIQEIVSEAKFLCVIEVS